MALRTRHAAFAVAAAAAFIAVAMLPPPPDPARVRFELRPRTRLQQLSGAEATIARRVEALEVQADVRARLQRAPVPPGAPPVLRVDTDVPAEWIEYLHSAWDTVTARLGPVHPQVALVMLVGRDTAERAWGRAWYFVPQGTDGHTCAVVPRLGATGRGFRSPEAVSAMASLLGPCAYYAAFGPPGPAIDAWLVREAMPTAHIPQWLEDTSRPRRPADADLVNTDVKTLITRMFDFGSLGDLDERACAAGRPDACRRVLGAAAPWRPRADPRLRALGIVPRPFAFRPWARSEVDYFLSDLIRDEGRDRFARFWSSAAPLDTAFQAAYGRSLESSVTEWLQSGWTIQPGPYIRTSSVVVSLALALAVVGVAAAWTTRRRAG